jgi:hypothetical protein
MFNRHPLNRFRVISPARRLCYSELSSAIVLASGIGVAINLSRRRSQEKRKGDLRRQEEIRDGR